MAGAAELTLGPAITLGRGGIAQFVVNLLGIAQGLQALPIGLMAMQVGLRHLVGSQYNCPWAKA